MEYKKGKPTGDRISALPEPIIHHILSFLPNKDAKVTSSLSKTWYYQISTSFPFLDFDFTWPVTSYFNFQPNKYLSYVDETLHKFHNHNDLNHQIQRFSLTIPFTPSLPELLDSWISLVLQHEIQDLNLNIGNRGDRRPNWYNLPRLVLVAKSIKVVKLVGCSLLRSFPANNRISGSTSNLLKLCIDNVVLDDLIFGSIISTCPLIEELSIIYCKGIKCFQISNLSKLRTLQIDVLFAEMVEIVAPSLQCLQISGPIKIRIIECPKLMDLDLNCVDFEDFQLQDFLLRLSFLRHLYLKGLSSLTSLKMSSDTLNKLTILGCHNIVELKIDAPNLCLLESDHCSIGSSTKQNVSYVARKRYGYSKTKGNPITVDDFLVMVRNSVSKASHLKHLNLLLQIIQPTSFEELNKRAVQPVVNIDYLTLSLCEINDVSKISYLDIFDGVLWSCHPHALSLRFPNKDVLMSIYEVMGHRHRPCKLSRSWLHYLEEVRYVAIDTSEGQLPMDGNSCLSISYNEIKLVFKW